MKLADLRRLAIRRQLRIHFPLPDGLECVIEEHGVAQAPALHRAPAFNFEEELASAGQFLVEPAPSAGSRAPARALTREELEAMLTPAAPAASGEE